MTFEGIKELFKRHLVISISIVTILVCILFYFVRIDLVDTKESEKQNLQMDLQQMSRALRNGNGLQEDLDEINSIVENIDSRLIQVGDLASNLNYFYKIEKETNVEIEPRQLQNQQRQFTKGKKKKTAKELYSKIEFEIRVTGEYENVLNFVDRLERGTSFYRLQKFRFQKGKGVNGKALSMNIKLVRLGFKKEGNK